MNSKDYKDNNNWLMLGDCLERMKEIPDGSVDLILQEEYWKPVLTLHSYTSSWLVDKQFTYPLGDYFVSDKGRFRNGNVILNGKPDSRGTITYSLKSKRFKLHQIVMQTFSPEGVVDYNSVDHINRFNRLDNSLGNLRWATRSTQYSNRENVKYKYKKVLCHQNM